MPPRPLLTWTRWRRDTDHGGRLAARSFSHSPPKSATCHIACSPPSLARFSYLTTSQPRSVAGWRISNRCAYSVNSSGWLSLTTLWDGCGGPCWLQPFDGKPTLIDRTAFNREVRALFRRVSVAPLAVVFETPASAVDPANYRSHGFLQQLDWIDTEPSFVRDCVIHYVQAQVARVKWADADAVSEASLRAYEEDLKMRMEAARKSEGSLSGRIPPRFFRDKSYSKRRLLGRHRS